MYYSCNKIVTNIPVKCFHLPLNCVIISQLYVIKEMSAH